MTTIRSSKTEGIKRTKRENSNPPAFEYQDFNTKAPSQYWRNARKEDIGEQFQVVEEYVVKDQLVPELRISNKFFQGRSQFVEFEVKPKLKKVKERQKAPVNSSSILPKPKKKQLALLLKKNIKKSADFYLDNILPITLSVDASASMIQDYTEQLLNERVPVPVGFLKKKMELAAQLRLVRELIKQFDLTTAEAAFLYDEFKHPR